MKATLYLRKDHESLQSALAQLLEGRKDKDALFNEVRREIEMHARVEEEFLYPELLGSASPDAAETAGRAIEDHQTILAMLGELAGMGVQHKQFLPKIQALSDRLNEHVEFEEDQLFEEARKSLSEYRLEELGLEMEQRRKMLQISAA